LLETVSADYEGQVTFLALGGSSRLDLLGVRADEWIPSGRIVWGYDEKATVWQALGVSGTPTTLLFAPDREVIAGWSGERGETFMREQIDILIASS
jgi:hypothetical protein